MHVTHFLGGRCREQKLEKSIKALFWLENTRGLLLSYWQTWAKTQVVAALTLKKGGPTLLYRNWPLLILFSILGGSKGKLDRPDFLLLFRQRWYFWSSLLWQHRWLKIVTKSIANLSMSSKTWLIAWASQGDVIQRRLSSGSLCVCVSLSALCDKSILGKVTCNLDEL